MEDKKKRIRRSDDQLLADTITQLYDRIAQRIVKVKDERIALDEIFEALHPLRSLEDSYRGSDGNQ